MKETAIVPVIETRVVDGKTEYRATYYSFDSGWCKSEEDAWLEFENWVTASFHSFGL
ncbi:MULTISPECIES: hypothetical protein [unclassified Nostoc]|uniref:hypothetical protein n=1 Tax=unclassified Nostoc TaxID=2593658 RepID=UPI002AD3E446|nr:hypothetical protein [Nostoc sp. DedQUE03]MDZ7976430.1 hypothetical protein [Nostoc sp. DedQUE03]MDZ8042755.1 hypothetical protein [Nostoc sp. DedQUE02]